MEYVHKCVHAYSFQPNITVHYYEMAKSSESIYSISGQHQACPPVTEDMMF